MVSTSTSIVAEIKEYMSKNGGAYSDWYVGIAADPKARLFNDHNVNEHSGVRIYRDAGSETEARRIEKHFLDLGCDGGDGGGGFNTRYVYAYKKTSFTKD